MARPRSNQLILEIPSFNGGSQIVTDRQKLEPQFARKIENMELDEIGMASMRRGDQLMGFHGPDVQAEIAVDSIVGYWHFDETVGTTADDVTGNNNDGTYVSSPTLGATGIPAMPASNKAVSLNGVDEEITFADSASLDTGDVFTFSCFLKRGAVSGGSNDTIAYKGVNMYHIYFDVNDKIVVSKAGVAIMQTSTVALTDTTSFHHIMVTKNGSTLKVYLDGVDITGTVTNQTLANNASALEIGAAAGTQFGNFTIDEASVHSTALAASRATMYYKAGMGLFRVLSAHVFERAGQTTQYIIHVDDGSLRYSSDLVTWTIIASGLSTTAPFSFVTFVDKVWATNGVNDYRSWDGSTQTTFASVPKFKFIEVWKDTLWGANDGTNAHRVYSSAAGDGTTWPGVNFVDVAKGQGFGITGLSSDANALIVFKLQQHHAIYDPVEYTNRIVDNEKGCLSHFSIIKHQGLIYFVSHLGICLYLGDAPAQIISSAIAPVFKDYVYQESQEPLWWGYTYKDRVGWCWPRDNVNDFWQVEYYPLYPDKPWIWHTHPVRVIVNDRAPGAEERIFGFGELLNKCYRLYATNIYTDDSAAFLGVYETPWFDFEAPHIPKYIDHLLLTARGDYNLDILRDFDGSTVIKSHAVDAGDFLDEHEIYTDVYARQVSFRFYNTSSAQATRQYAVGSEVESVNEGRFAIGRLLAIAKPCGEYR